MCPRRAFCVNSAIINQIITHLNSRQVKVGLNLRAGRNNLFKTQYLHLSTGYVKLNGCYETGNLDPPGISSSFSGGNSLPRRTHPAPRFTPPGEAVQGVVLIQIEVDPAQSTGFDISFAYQDGINPTWFLIAESQQINSSQIQAAWDTTTISDGNYQLRLRVNLKSGLTSEIIATGIRIRNYSIIETSTPSPTPVVTGTPIPPTPTLQNSPTPGIPTPLPANPVQFDQTRLLEGIKVGLLTVAGIFAFIGIYTSLRRIRHRRER